jgi:hypothetical protein
METARQQTSGDEALATQEDAGTPLLAEPGGRRRHHEIERLQQAQRTAVRAPFLSLSSLRGTPEGESGVESSSCWRRGMIGISTGAGAGGDHGIDHHKN